MDGALQSRAEQLATEFASQATTVEELNELMRLMIRTAKRNVRILTDTTRTPQIPGLAPAPCSRPAPVRSWKSWQSG